MQAVVDTLKEHGIESVEEDGYVRVEVPCSETATSATATS